MPTATARAVRPARAPGQFTAVGGAAVFRMPTGGPSYGALNRPGSGGDR